MGGLRISVIVLILFIIALAGCGAEEPPEARGDENGLEGVPPPAAAPEEAAAAPLKLDEIPVSRAYAAKMVALTFLTPGEIDETGGADMFTDVNGTDWFYKYVNAAARNKYMVGGDGEFRPESPLSIYEAQLLIDRLNPSNATHIKITPETKDLPISLALWQELYIKALEELSGESTPEQKFGLEKAELFLLATPGNADGLPRWSIVADKGWYFLRGLGIDSYIDKRVSVYAKGNEIVTVSGAEGEEILENAYITGRGNGVISVYSGGVERSYKYGGGETLPEITDIKITGETAEPVNSPTDKKSGVIKRAGAKYVELGDGSISLDKNAPVYELRGNKPYFGGGNGLIPGTSASLYLRGGKICAAVVEAEQKPDKMRVLITSTDYRTAVHTSVKISATSDFTITGEEGEKKYMSGDIVVFDGENNSGLFSSERLYVTPDGAEGRIELQSITRSGETPKYRGTIELSKEGEAFVVVNELDMEEYLYAVVSSQIPETLGEEAARAQAVLARSAAHLRFYENRLARYGANTDDTIKSQLYNAAPETETSVRAVDGTRGEVLVYGEELVRPAFFLASSGSTANRGETFMKAGGTGFPSDTPEYLKAAKQYEGDVDYGDLSAEENASRFFKSGDVNAPEKDVSWFRWSVEMSKAEAEAAINASIAERERLEPSNVLTLTEGVYMRKPIAGIGELLDMEAVKRGEGGNIMELKITGTNGEYLLKTESTIRAVVRPYQHVPGTPPVELARADGTVVQNYYQMPSAFYSFDIERGENAEIASVKFYGGGNGHGVGMSQCGAKALADGGASYKEILRHYFGGAELAVR